MDEHTKYLVAKQKRQSENNKYIMVTDRRPKALRAFTGKKGFVGFEFRHASGAWRKHVPMRASDTPQMRAVFKPEPQV